ncbi:MAG: peptidyl-prolyl cis-trans isomerase [Gammaproteobacteria bacterium]|nr:peptidyl-prolyl cis-trans isomerase [Gammaproteobacteria bacterium]
MTRSRALLYPLVAVLALLVALAVALDFTVPGYLAKNTHAIARVNDATIPMAEYVRAIDAMQAGLERPLTPQDRSRAVTVLIDEELIVQEALRLNLASDDRLVRKNLVQALIGSVVVEAQLDPSEQTLKDFYTKEKALFTGPVRVRVSVLRAATSSATDAFVLALRNGATFADAGSAANLSPVPIAPDIPLAKLGEVLGGPARDAVVAMVPGDIAGPVRSTGGDVFIWLLDTDHTEPVYAEVRSSVLAEWQRRQQELALERYLVRLRERARIHVYANDDITYP